MSTPQPTGRPADRDGTAYLVFERTFEASIDDVWAAVTDPERLVRWIGTWAGDPARGEVVFRMTAESPDAPEEPVIIDECREPTRLVLRSPRPDDPRLLWTWQVDLSESDGVTTLTFAQEACTVLLAEGVGPAWDYYLDRMVAAESGADPDTVDLEAYFPAFSGHYRDALS